VIWLLPPPQLCRQQIVSLPQSSCVSPVGLIDGRGGGKGAGGAIIRRRESLVLYKSFNTPWIVLSAQPVKFHLVFLFRALKPATDLYMYNTNLYTTRFLILFAAMQKWNIFSFLSGMRSVWVPRGPDSARVSDHPLFAIPHEKNCRLHFFYFTPQHVYEWHASPGSRGHFTSNRS
jgi:hypothetical protein